jgi:hypothetical protein
MVVDGVGGLVVVRFDWRQRLETTRAPLLAWALRLA